MKKQKIIWIVTAVAIVLVAGCAIGLIISKGNHTKPIVVEPNVSVLDTESTENDIPEIVDDNKNESEKKIRGEIDIDVVEVAKENANNPEPAVEGDVFVIQVKGDDEQ